MDINDLEKQNRFAIVRCLSNAMRMTGQHASTLARRITKLFSRLNCMNVDVKMNGHVYTRPILETEKSLVIKHVEQNLASKLAGGDVPSRSSSYDSLADETLSVRASTLSSPATTFMGTPSASSFTPTSSLSSSRSAWISTESVVTVTPYSLACVTPNPSRRSAATYTVVSALESPSACKSPRSTSDIGTSDTSSLSSSPFSYYRSSTDLSVEDIEDQEFWDFAPKHN